MGDEDLAVAIAQLAGSVLSAFAASALWAGRQLGATAEIASNRIILDALAAHRPADPVLSEQGDGGSHNEARCWIVDPLDGTREFVDRRDDWAVQIGLAVRGRPALGVVFLPARSILLRSDQPPPLPRAGRKVRILVSRTRPAAEADKIAILLKGELVRMGSAGAKVAALLEGKAEVYLHSGGQSQWDSCAPVAIALAAGLDATRLNGEPLVYGEEDPDLPDLVVSHPAVTGKVRRALSSLRRKPLRKKIICDAGDCGVPKRDASQGRPADSPDRAGPAPPAQRLAEPLRHSPTSGAHGRRSLDALTP